MDGTFIEINGIIGLWQLDDDRNPARITTVV